MSKSKSDEAITHFSALMAEQNTKVLSENTLDFFADTHRLSQIARQRKNIATEKAQGWIFEQLEATKFNLDALRKNSSLKASTTDALGEINDTLTDIRIKDRNTGEILKNYQAKSCSKATGTIQEFFPEQYEKVNLVGSSDQFDHINDLVDSRIKKENIYSERYKSIKERLDKGINHDGVESGGTTHQEAVKNTEIEVADKTASTFRSQAIQNEMHQAGMQAGLMSASIGGGTTLLSGLWRMHKGESSATKVALDTVYSSASSFAGAYATAAAAKGIPHLLAKAGVGEAALKTLTKSNAHTAIAAGVIQSTKHIGLYLKGDIEFDQMINEVSGTAIITSSSFYYAALGQLAIPVPVLGAMVGSTVGYFIGSILHQSGIISLGESTQVRIARERRERVEQICLESIARMQASRLAMSELIDKHFTEQAAALSIIFSDMDKSMVSWDADGFVNGLSMLNERLGCSLPFEDFKSFKEFMDDDEAVFVL